MALRTVGNDRLVDGAKLDNLPADTNAALSAKVDKTTTVNGKALSSNISITASDVGADPTGTAAAAIVTHVALPDPHAQYQKESEKDAAGGYAGLDGSTKLNASQLPSTVTTQGNSFNGVSQLVQTTAAGKLPALDGSLLTNLPASGHTIQNSGVAMTQRTNLNFTGTGVALTDDAGNNATVVTITGGSGGSAINYQDVFTGNGATSVYTLSAAPGSAKAVVTLNGNQSEPTTDYTIAGSTLTFGSNVPNGWKIVVSYVAASSTVLWTLGVSYNPGTVIPTGVLSGVIAAPRSGTIVGYKFTSIDTTNMVVDVWKANGAIPTVANTITASAKPTLTAAKISDSTTLTGWTTSVAEGDRFVFNVDSNSASTAFTLELIMSS